MAGMTTTRRPKPAAMAPITLRRMIAGAELSITDAADKLGVSRQTVYRWLRGEITISRSAAALIRETFLKK